MTLPPLTQTIISTLDSKTSVRGRQRTGKIARLPKPIRERINLLLDEGLEYDAILKDLGPHAEGLNHQNLTNWRKGGYQDYLDHQAKLDCIKTQTEAAADLAGACGEADRPPPLARQLDSAQSLQHRSSERIEKPGASAACAGEIS